MSKLYQKMVEAMTAQGQREMLAEGETRWTGQVFLDQVNAAAAGLKGQGIQAGDRVGIMTFNQKEFLVALLALRKIGAVAVPINIMMLPQDIGYVLHHSGMRHMVISNALYPKIQMMPLQFMVIGEAEGAPKRWEDVVASGQGHETDAEKTNDTDLAFLIYTSGTTGTPKGVMLSEQNILSNMDGFKHLVPFDTASDRIVQALPLFHAYGLMVSLTVLTLGIPQVLIPQFAPKTIIETVMREKPTVLPLVPTLYSVILDLAARNPEIRLDFVKFCVSGGAALPVALLEKIKTVLHTQVIEGYGLTECSPVVSVNDPMHGNIPGSVGKPLPNITVRIVNENGQPVATAEQGEITLKGDNVMLGYFNDPEATQAVMTSEGYFKTGDLGHLDGNGYLFISGGRIKDLIIKGGENISPAPIESVLYQHPAVKDAAVIPIPHAKLGEDIAACVTLKEGQEATPQDLIRHCREQLPASHVPAHVEIMAELPKNPAGKIMKKLLREQLAKALPIS